MINIKKIRENPEEVKQGLAKRGADPALLNDVLALDVERRKVLSEVESLKSRRNSVSKEIGQAKKRGENTDAIQKDMRELGENIAEQDQLVKDLDARLQDCLLKIPNLPHASTPMGSSAADNKEIKMAGKKREFSFKPLNHIELGQKLGMFDFERGTKLAGAGFPLYVGMGSRLQRALIQFMLDLHVTEHGYTEVWPPAVVNTDSMIGTGQLPKMADDMYHATDDMWLIPTAEVPVTNIYRDEIIDRDLPIYLTAYTPCFRREAGAAGKDTRGLIRVHQFDKVEMVKFVEPASSYDELETLTANAEDVLQRLGLCYRILSLCSGDISFAAAKCYDIELWAPGQDGWLEVSSCSNFEDFQARRAAIRYRDADGKVQFVHTLNGSGVALPRLVVAILENYQNEDGSVEIPEALQSYMGGLKRIDPVQ